MRVAVIGGSGKIGRWFADFLNRDGFDIVVSGRNQAKLEETQRQLGVAVTTDNVAAVKDAEVILLSVPITNFETVVKQIAPHTRPEQIVVDVTSVKTMPVEVMHRHLKAQILGGHPVFGPGAKDLTSRSLILTPTNKEETALAQKIQQYLESKGARVTLMPPEEHDELMAVILGFSHLIAIVAADTLLRTRHLKRLGEIGGVTFRLLLTLVESVISEDPDFYASLQMSLPHLLEIETTFRERVNKWVELVANKDNIQFAQKMRDLKTSFKQVNPEFGSAYEDMYKFIEVLQKPTPEG